MPSPTPLISPVIRWWRPGLLFGALLLAYWPVLHGGFSPWDDRIYTEDNPLVREGLSAAGVGRAFTSTWENNWSPLFWVFLASQVSLGGGVVHPAVFHAAGLALCLLNAGLLWILLRKFGVSENAALLASAWFGLHPLGVEAVAWISAQKHLLAATALLASLIFLRSAGPRPGGGFSSASLVAFGLSLMSSPIGVGLPVFIFAWEMGDPGRTGRDRWVQALAKSAPYLVLALVAAGITLYANWNPGAQVVPWFAATLSHRLVQALAALGWQMGALVWPWHLAPAYPWPERPVILMIMGVAFLAGLGGMLAQRRRLISAGAAGFLACFLPVSGLLALPIVFTADRLVYVPGIFLALALGRALDLWLPGRRWLALAGGLVAVGLGLLSFRQVWYWHDEKSILARTLAQYPGSISAQVNQAVVLGREGDWAGALAGFRRVRGTDPTLVVVWRNEIAILEQLERREEAASVSAAAVAAIPASPDLRLQYGLLLEQLGRERDALEQLRKARELDPMSVQTTFQYSRLLVRLERARDALPLLDLLEFTMRGQPAYWETRAAACEQTGDRAGVERARAAIAQLRK